MTKRQKFSDWTLFLDVSSKHSLVKDGEIDKNFDSSTNLSWFTQSNTNFLYDLPELRIIFIYNKVYNL